MTVPVFGRSTGAHEDRLPRHKSPDHVKYPGVKGGSDFARLQGAIDDQVTPQNRRRNARKILGEDPHDTNYFGRKEVGEFLAGILGPGATVESRDLLREVTGEGLSAKAMRDYFAPLMEWLVEQNQGRTHTLPEI